MRNRKLARPKFATRTFSFIKQPAAASTDKPTRIATDLYRQLFEHTRTIKLVIDPLTLQILEANPAACAFYGYPLAHFKTLRLTDINIAPESEINSSVQKASASESILEARHRLASGELRDVEIQAGGITVDGQRVHYAIIHDITERKRTESALRRTEERYRLFIRNMPASGVLIFDTDMRLTLVDGPLLKRVNLTAEMLVGKLLPDTPFEPDTIKFLIPVFQRALKGESFTYQRQMPDYAYEAHVAPLKDDDGQIIGGMALAHDITERKRTESALRRSEERYRLFTRNMPDSSVIMFDTDMRYTLVEGPFLKRFGTVAETMLGKLPHEVLLTAEALNFIVPIYQRALNGESFSYQRQMPDYAYQAHVTPVKDDSGQIIGGMVLSHDITERKRLEEQLRASEEQLRFITDNMHDMVIRMDAADRIIYASPSSRHILGLEPEAMLGQYRKDFVHPDDRDRAAAALQHIMQQRLTTAVMQGRLRHADGHYVSVETAAQFFYDEQSNYLGGVFNTRDITERKNLEEQLRANEEQLRFITDHMQDMITRSDADDQIIYASPSSRQLLGIEPEAVVGHPRRDFVHPDDWAKTISKRTSMIQQRIPHFTMQGRVRHADGHYINVETVANFLYDDQSNYIGAIFNTRDITERKRLEDQLRASEEQLRFITDHMQDMVTRSDAHETIIYASPASRQLLGIEPEAVVGHSRRDFVHPDDWEKMVSGRMRIIQQHISHGTMQGRLRHADGHYISVETVANFLYDDQSNYLGGIYATRDITERKRLEEILLDNQKTRTALEKEQELGTLKTRMMERIAHEFRTPLTTIQIATETLTYYHDRLTSEKRLQKNEVVKGQIQRITDMLDEIALVVRGVRGAEALNRAPTDLAALCHDIIATLNLPNKYRLEAPASLFAAVDSSVLEDAILHILRNAARFSAPQSPVNVHLSQVAANAELRIIDHGIGIPANELPRIFEPFFRGSNINERGGLGIGLTIVRAAIEAHGGSIRVESELNHGTTVIITLPLTPDPRPSLTSDA